MFINYSCKYHEILGYDHDMYVMKYVGMLRIYISQMNIRSAEYIYISIKYSIRSTKNRYIYDIQKVPILARCNIVFKDFSYDVCIGYIHPKQLISNVDMFVFF